MWEGVKRLRGTNPFTKLNYTHVCINPIPADEFGGTTCNKLLRLHKRNKKDIRSGYVSTPACEHLMKDHADSVVGAAAIRRGHKRHDGRVKEMMATEGACDVANQHKKASSCLDSYRLSPQQGQLTAQAKWYVYSEMYISKRSFEDDYFKAMFTSFDVKAKVLTVKMLKNYVKAEFSVFLLYLAFIVGDKQAHAKGNCFAQCIHDGGTLANKKKFQAFGIQFVDRLWRANFVICVGFVRCHDSSSQAVARMFKDVFLLRTHLNLDDVVGSSIQDRAAKSVASVLGLEEEVCGMHDGKLINIFISPLKRVVFPNLRTPPSRNFAPRLPIPRYPASPDLAPAFPHLHLPLGLKMFWACIL